MNVLIIGNGGREHAIAKKLSQSDCQLYYYGPNTNPGMDQFCKIMGVGSYHNLDEIRELALENKIKIVVVGPELPLSLGITNYLQKVGIHVIGPTKELAQIETSKLFCRNLLYDHGLDKYSPSLLHIIKKGDDFRNTMTILESLLCKHQIVIKEDGLCGGKGVKIQGEHFNGIKEASDICKELMLQEKNILIEEKLVGEEFSIMSFSDGYYLQHMIPVKDYKRLLDGDQGPNTGSMGSVTGYGGQLWFLNNDDIKTCHHINEIVITILKKICGKPYKGILYGSFMKTKGKKEIKIIEFNARFGDPECINVLELLQTDLLEVFKGICNQTLNQITLKFKEDASIFKYKVPSGYPYLSNKEETLQLSDDDLIMSSIKKIGKDEYQTLGSRCFGLLITGNDLVQMTCQLNKKLDHLAPTLLYRKDIGEDLCLNYHKAGVNSQEKEKAIQEIKENIESTYKPEVTSQFGDFAGIMKISDGQSLITSTDGVGTKSILILEHYGYEKGFEMLGYDLVNLNVNDILVKGGRPLFFVDYFGCQKLDANHLKYFVKGIVKGCLENDCVLLKGETAQMPDIYKENTFDLVGTIVGLIKDDEVINGKNTIQENDLVVCLPSNGPHTNGFTLIRKILDRIKDYENINHEIIELICQPHKSYYHEVKQLKDMGIKIHGLCHITGGGLVENPDRVLPENLQIKYYEKDYLPVFKYLQEKGHLNDLEMRKTFNCGIGMMVFMRN